MELNFKLSMEMTNIIVNALGEAPYRVSAPVINELQTQAAAQMKPHAVPANVEEDKKEKA
jgi:hypothetical protein